MRARIKFLKWVSAKFVGGEDQPFALISINKKKFRRVYIAVDLGRFLDDVKSVDISNRYFPQSLTKLINLRQGFEAAGDVEGNYICEEWLHKLGLNIGDLFYVKVNRK